MSKLIAAGLIAFFAVIYFALEQMNYSNRADWSIYLIPLGLLLVLLYIFHYQIDWWWHKRNPPKLDSRVIQILNHNLPYYNSLNESQQNKFNERLSLYMMRHRFLAQGSEQEDFVPEDIKAMTSMHAIMLTLNKENYLMDPFEHIIFYKHPFPSPRYQFLHASEIDKEDGALIFSLEQLAAGILKSDKHYNIALHEYAEAYLHIYQNENWPEIDDLIWEKLQTISSFKKSYLINLFGEIPINPLAVMINYFFSFPEAFQKELPNAYVQLAEIFGQAKA
ncbi:MAG: zinc-dependent peptidase [Bacteroidota bacterium]